MRTRLYLISGILGTALAGYVLTGCHKDSSNSPSSSGNGGYSTDITPAEDDANATYTSDDSKNMADAAIQWQSSFVPRGQLRRLMGLIYGQCVNIYGKDTMIGANNDTVVYIDFGSHDCSCVDGRNRRGTLIVYWGLEHAGETRLQAYFDSANTITLIYKNYYLKDNAIAGVKTWTNEGHDSAGYENWDYTANITITYPSGQTAMWVSSRNSAFTQVNGAWYHEITGNGHGTSRTGITYTLAITSPVYITVAPWWAGGCPWPESGIVTITRTGPNGSGTMTVNYGTVGTCSGNKNVTINGNIQAFAMW